MGNGVSTDQGNFPTHGIRDVRRAADRKQHDWSQLAEAPITNSLLVGRRSCYARGNEQLSETKCKKTREFKAFISGARNFDYLTVCQRFKMSRHFVSWPERNRIV